MPAALPFLSRVARMSSCSLRHGLCIPYAARSANVRKFRRAACFTAFSRIRRFASLRRICDRRAARRKPPGLRNSPIRRLTAHLRPRSGYLCVAGRGAQRNPPDKMTPPKKISRVSGVAIPCHVPHGTAAHKCGAATRHRGLLGRNSGGCAALHRPAIPIVAATRRVCGVLRIIVPCGISPPSLFRFPRTSPGRLVSVVKRCGILLRTM